MVIRTAKKKKRSSSTTSLRKRLWSGFFSPYIRLKEGYKCYTCGKQLAKKGSFARHFVHKDCLDFDERNIHCQCYYCNVYQSGNRAKYAEYLERDYGYGIIQELNKLGDKQVNWRLVDLTAIIDYYKQRLELLNKKQSDNLT